jgi:hypothetical protein
MNTYLSEIKSILSRPHLQKRARECGFFKHKDLIDADAFFDLLLYCANRTENSSLSFMSSNLERCHDTVVSPVRQSTNASTIRVKCLWRPHSVKSSVSGIKNGHRIIEKALHLFVVRCKYRNASTLFDSFSHRIYFFL